jgi:hypothetical protein
MTDDTGSRGGFFSQPRAVWAVAFAAVVSFMGLGLVDPILPAIAMNLHASPSQVELLFTSYFAFTGISMLVSSAVASRIGTKRTLLAGLVLIIAFSAAAGASDSVGAIVALRAGWGLGNALFIATALSVIVGSVSGGVAGAGAVVLYEAALGLGISVGPLLGGERGTLSVEPGSLRPCHPAPTRLRACAERSPARVNRPQRHRRSEPRRRAHRSAHRRAPPRVRSALALRTPTATTRQPHACRPS